MGDNGINKHSKEDKKREENEQKIKILRKYKIKC